MDENPYFSLNSCPSCGEEVAVEVSGCPACGGVIPTGPPAEWIPEDVIEFGDVRTDVAESVAGADLTFDVRCAPADGLAARPQPDPSLEPVTEIGGNAGVVVIERAGAWARVMAEGGRVVWVDDRLLTDADAPPETD